MPNYDVLILYSGGADSRLMIEFAKMLKKEPYCLMIDYNQKHYEELEFAEEQLDDLDIDFQKIIVDGLDLNSALTGDNISGRFGDDVSEYHVPGRNTMFAGIAFSVAENLGIKEIWLGADWSDVQNNFVDCKPEFINKINELFKVNGSFPIEFKAPLLGLEKQTILSMLENIGVNSEDIYSGYGEDDNNSEETEKFDDLVEDIDEFLKEYTKNRSSENKYNMIYEHYINLPAFYPNIDLDGKTIIVEGMYRLEGHDVLSEGYGIIYEFDSIKKISPNELDNYLTFCNITDLEYIDEHNKKDEKVFNINKEKYFYLDAVIFDENKEYYITTPGVYRLYGFDINKAGYGIIYRFEKAEKVHKDALKNYEYICKFV